MKKRMFLLFAFLSWGVMAIAGFSVGGGFVPARPAMAQFGVPVSDYGRTVVLTKHSKTKWANWIEDLGLLGKIIKGITSGIDEVVKWFKKILKTEKSDAALKTAGYEAMTRAEIDLTQVKVDAGVQNTELEVMTEIRRNNVQVRNEQLCKMIMAHQLATTTEEFETLVACFAASAIETMFRLAGQDGMGPDYIAQKRKANCEAGLGSPEDGASKDCIDSTTKGTDERKMDGQNLSGFILDGGQVLEIPKMKSQSSNGVTFSVPDPQTDEQKYWRAGLFHCIELAGPRPTPPSKEQLKEPKGKTVRAQWNHCAVVQNALIWPCASLLAYYTRPNSELSKLREDQNERCKAAEAANVKLPDSFGECKKGLSSYQSLYIAQQMCKSYQNYISQSHGGASHPEMSAAVDKCTASWNAWQSMEASRKNAKTKATEGLAELAPCWLGAVMK